MMRKAITSWGGGPHGPPSRLESLLQYPHTSFMVTASQTCGILIP